MTVQYEFGFTMTLLVASCSSQGKTR